MSARFERGAAAMGSGTGVAHAIAEGVDDRPLAFDAQGIVPLVRFLAHVRGVARCLPEAGHAINLCEDRYRFLVSLCAAGLRGQVTLLPPARTPEAIAQAHANHPGSYALGDAALDDGRGRSFESFWPMPETLPEASGLAPRVADNALAVIGFTSGSTGVPTANPKTWGSFRTSTAQNLSALRDLWPEGEAAYLVATVPPQHMYGMELSVMMPLLCDVAVHAARPFFPGDVARALGDAPANRLLVTTPVHLRALVESGIGLPPMRGIVSATAPLAPPLASAAEARFGCEVRELFGSTETCVIARRRTASETAWTPLAGVRVVAQPDGALVHASHLATSVRLADLVEVDAHGHFALRGRNADLLEIAGKRASLGDLTRKLQAIPGVQDAVVFQLDDEGRGVRRIAALVVAPTLHEAQILAALRAAIDPVFLPRPLRRVDALPRNETGKLPRDALLALLRGNMQ